MTHAASNASPIPTPLGPGASFGHYRVSRCIGTGGMGAVFEGTHELLARRVAIKVLHGKGAEKPEARERFLREAQNVARIRHPHVVEVFDVGLLGDQPYLVMEYLEGETLESAFSRIAPTDERQAASVMIPIAAALTAVHRAGMVHRDVKPENVFLASDSKGHAIPKLVDFGIAKDLTVPLLGDHHTVVGTPHYMSPEQARGALTLDARTDQYSFGVLFYELLTGRLPFDAESLLDLVRAIDAGAAVPIGALRPELDPALASIVMRAMARDADDRFESMQALGRALLPFASDRLRATFASDFGVSTTASSPPPAFLRTSEVSGEIRVGSQTTTLDRVLAPHDAPGRITSERAISGSPAADSRHALPTEPRSRRTLYLTAGLVALALLLAIGIGTMRTPEPSTPVVATPAHEPVIDEAPQPIPAALPPTPIQAGGQVEPPEAAPAPVEEPTPATMRAPRPRPAPSEAPPARPLGIRLDR